MKTLNFLLASLFLVFLLSSTSAVSVSYGEWAVSSSITDGQSTSFNYDFYHYGTSSMQMSIKLYDSSNNLVYTFLDTSTSSASYYNTVSITESIYKNPGTYSLTFYSKDSDNVPNVMTIYLTVSPDTTAPVITLIGNNPQTIVQGNAYTELGATASDNKDGDLTSKITATVNVNTNLIGTYYITYSVFDDAGNAGTAIRTVYVVDPSSVPDTTDPVITIIGSNPIIIDLGSTYNDAGATATDDRDGNLTSQINVSSNVNTSVLGTYQVNYTVSDLAGNTATETRTVTVRDLTGPSVEISYPSNKTYYYSKTKKTMDVKISISSDAVYCWYVMNNETYDLECSDTKIDNVHLMTGENNLTVYAEDSAGNIGSDNVIFKYIKKSSSSGSSGGYSFTTSTIKDETEPTQNIVIPQTNETNNDDAITVLLYFLIATTSLGIVILSILLLRKLKELKEEQEAKQEETQIYSPSQNQDSPYY